MEIAWNVSENDIQNAKEVIKNNQNAFLKARRKRNVKRENITINKDTIIRTLLMCIFNISATVGSKYPRWSVFKKNSISNQF